jgi:hypothetical protein
MLVEGTVDTYFINRTKHINALLTARSFHVPASGIDTGCSKQTHNVVDGKSWMNMLDNFVWRDNQFPGRCSGRQGPTEWPLCQSAIELNQRGNTAITIKSS